MCTVKCSGAQYANIYRYRLCACMAVCFLDVNGIIEKQIITCMTFGKYTRQVSRSRTAAMSDIHAMVLQSLVNLLQAKPSSR